MTDGIRWSVVLACPSEAELPLLAELSARRDARIVAVADPDRTSLGAELAAIMGIPVVEDLDQVDRPAAHLLVHGALSAAVTALLDDADDLGMETARADAFTARLHAPTGGATRVTTAPATRPADETIENETAAIHRTLSRIEEALDRESLLRWVLGLSMRAVGAGSGSIMLLDESTDELYVAFALGLSDATRHDTRVRPGEGIAGRVLASGRAERIEHGGAAGRDRGAIIDAVCAPIVRSGRVLGVVNLSASASDGPLAPDALARAGALSHRLGELLERFLRLQDVADRDRLRRLDESLGLDLLDAAAPLDVLQEWSRRLAAGVGAETVTVGLLTADGDLCQVGEGIDYQSPPGHDEATVLVSGAPVVTRTADGTDPRTVIRLPVGRDPVRVVLSVTFASAAAAHRFRTGSEDFLYVVRRHLGHVPGPGRPGRRGESADGPGVGPVEPRRLRGDEGSRERVLAAARRLTGARRADQRRGRSQGGSPAGRGPAAAAPGRRPGLGRQRPGRPARRGRPPGHPGGAPGHDPTASGAGARGQARVHALDAAVFTETDALFARRLLPLLRHRGVPRNRRRGRRQPPLRRGEPRRMLGAAAPGNGPLRPLPHDGRPGGLPAAAGLGTRGPRPGPLARAAALQRRRGLPRRRHHRGDRARGRPVPAPPAAPGGGAAAGHHRRRRPGGAQRGRRLPGPRRRRGGPGGLVTRALA